MRMLPYYIVAGFTLACFTSCIPHDSTGLSSKDAHNVLELKKTKEDSLKFWDFRRFSSKLILTGVYKNEHQTHISSYSRNSTGAWAPISSDTLAGNIKLHKTEWVPVNKQTYLYIEFSQSDSTERKNQDKHTVVFNLYQPLTGQLLKLEYEYRYLPNNLQGRYIAGNADSLKKYPLEFAFLRKRAGLSGLIPAEDKKNMRPGADSALKKWAMLNEGVYDAVKGRSAKPVQLNIEEYNSDISPGPEEFDNDTLVFKLNTLVSQNGQYKAESEVKGPVYIVNKATGKSFIIWAPPESKSWIHKMVFRSGNLLTIYPSATDSSSQGVASFELNLTQKTIRQVMHQAPVRYVKSIKHSTPRHTSRKALPARRPKKRVVRKKHHRGRR